MLKIYFILVLTLLLTGCNSAMRPQESISDRVTPSASSSNKLIIDTDFTTIGDDGQALIMAAQLHKQGIIKLLGVTVLTGNVWLKQASSDALRAVERMGIEVDVGVYAGANLPLVNDPRRFKNELAMFGTNEDYQFSFYFQPPADKDIIPPIDGFATHSTMREESAIDFIINTVKANPHEVSILAIGPATNIAMAIHKAPDIIPLIKRIVYMAGAVEVPGNATIAAETNVWIDPEAMHNVFRQPIDQTIVPLDVTNTIQIDKRVYDQISSGDGIVARLFRASVSQEYFNNNQGGKLNVYDTLALAFVIDETLATDIGVYYMDIDINLDHDYGHMLAYVCNDTKKTCNRLPKNESASFPARINPVSARLLEKELPDGLLQKIKVIRKFDSKRFFDLYVDLLTRHLN
ncbi:nucleoside hydrolase [Salmonella enterica subsp. enterica]|nr:nucleoside hydrolase [Salmonella enterica subsp. enterica]